MYRELIIVRKDLDMSKGKMAAQVSHAAMAFLNNTIMKSLMPAESNYQGQISINKGIYEEWMQASYTKTIMEAKNKNQLLKAKRIAEELGLEENKDFFFIYDNCLTELTPEENGKCLTCMGFRPLDEEMASKISKKFQLFQDRDILARKKLQELQNRILDKKKEYANSDEVLQVLTELLQDLT